jgi:hypothetical protein
MQTTLRKLSMAALTLTGLSFLGDRPARAQNTYADVPFNQGSLFYRPSGAKPPATTSPSSSAPRRFFRRQQRAYRYVTPAPAARVVTPGYAPQAVVPTTRDYYPTR